ncbi:unnamed protein product [Protopolystoma xenopodis]|uniref:C2H2-type domain-containing protein n=1 Tax=Protopolystoma xenopodis TaxID=117903 RepID=A0A3S5B934_9PLAT|nr:unnamed protein product [Protopolystoma xenopodis]
MPRSKGLPKHFVCPGSSEASEQDDSTDCETSIDCSQPDQLDQLNEKMDQPDRSTMQSLKRPKHAIQTDEPECNGFKNSSSSPLQPRLLRPSKLPPNRYSAVQHRPPISHPNPIKSTGFKSTERNRPLPSPQNPSNLVGTNMPQTNASNNGWGGFNPGFPASFLSGLDFSSMSPMQVAAVLTQAAAMATAAALAASGSAPPPINPWPICPQPFLPPIPPTNPCFLIAPLGLSRPLLDLSTPPGSGVSAATTTSTPTPGGPATPRIGQSHASSSAFSSLPSTSSAVLSVSGRSSPSPLSQVNSPAYIRLPPVTIPVTPSIRGPIASTSSCSTPIHGIPKRHISSSARGCSALASLADRRRTANFNGKLEASRVNKLPLSSPGGVLAAPKHSPTGSTGSSAEANSPAKLVLPSGVCLTERPYREPVRERDRETINCPVCAKLMRRGSLREHMDRHQNSGRFDCEICGKNFSRQSAKEKHIRTHTGERPFVCKFCDKAYRQKVHLNEHLRSHTGERPYVCRLCGFSLASKSLLNRHLRTHGVVVNANEAPEMWLKTDAPTRDVLAAAAEVGRSLGFEKTARPTGTDDPTSETGGPANGEAADQPASKSLTGAPAAFGQAELDHQHQHLNHHNHHNNLQQQSQQQQIEALPSGVPRLTALKGSAEMAALGRKYLCSHCPAGFPTMQALRSHRATTHGVVTPHRCSSCNESFSSVKTLKIHLRKAHPQVSLPKLVICSVQRSWHGLPSTNLLGSAMDMLC